MWASPSPSASQLFPDTGDLEDLASPARGPPPASLIQETGFYVQHQLSRGKTTPPHPTAKAVKNIGRVIHKFFPPSLPTPTPARLLPSLPTLSNLPCPAMVHPGKGYEGDGGDVVAQLIDGQDAAANHFSFGGDEGGHHQARAVAKAKGGLHEQRLQSRRPPPTAQDKPLPPAGEEGAGRPRAGLPSQQSQGGLHGPSHPRASAPPAFVLTGELARALCHLPGSPKKRTRQTTGHPFVGPDAGPFPDGDSKGGGLTARG